MQLDIHGTGRRHSIDDAFEKPLSRRALDGEGIDGAVVHRHVPLIAIPRLGLVSRVGLIGLVGRARSRVRRGGPVVPNLPPHVPHFPYPPYLPPPSLARNIWRPMARCRPGPPPHTPHVLHGPAAVVMAPLESPCRSVITRTGRPSAICTRAGIGKRKRRNAVRRMAGAQTLRGSVPPPLRPPA